MNETSSTYKYTEEQTWEQDNNNKEINKVTSYENMCPK